MYTLAPDQVGQMPPMPGGCLTQWHTHTSLCFSDVTGAVVASTRQGPCRAGLDQPGDPTNDPRVVGSSTGGPLTVDDSDTQVVRAAEQMSPPVPRNTMA